MPVGVLEPKATVGREMGGRSACVQFDDNMQIPVSDNWIAHGALVFAFGGELLNGLWPAEQPAGCPAQMELQSRW